MTLSKSTGVWIQRIVIGLGLLFFIVYMLGPIYIMVETSLAPERDQLSVPVAWLPSTIDFSQYTTILFPSPTGNQAARGFTRSLANTFIVATGVTLISLFVGSLAAYAFARLRVPGRDKLVLVVLFTETLPGIAILVPLYLTIRSLGILDNLLTVILLECSFALPFATWILRGYFLSLPAELEDAAMVDGCGRLGALFRVILPLSQPGLFAVSAFAFLGSWNAFLIPLIFTGSEETRTAPLAVSFLIGRFYVQFGLLAAAGVLASLVPVILALIFQRYLLEGLVAGSIKG